MNKLKLMYIPAICILLFSCNGLRLGTPDDFYKYLNKTENGYIKERKQNQFIYKVKYLPTAFFVLNEIQYNTDVESSNSYIDSLFNLYKGSRTFLLTISTGEEANRDIMFENITSEEDYRERVEQLNFNLKEHIYLNTDNNKYLPVLVNLENVYGLSNSRNINIVFSPLEKNDDLMISKEYDLVFEDVVFNTGINHFKFHKKDIDRSFELTFLNNSYHDKK